MDIKNHKVQNFEEGSHEEFQKKCGKSHHRKIERFYKMDHPRRGIALIFNQEFFDDGRYRCGTNADCKELKKALEYLDFDVKVYENLTFQEIVEALKEVASMDHSKYDCLWITVLSHGEMGYISAKDIGYEEEMIWSFFTADKCPTLAGKPKIFFVQACRGSQFDDGFSLEEKVYKIERIDDWEDCLDVSFIEEKNAPKFEIQFHPDFFIMYATQPGFYSFRHPVDGSWFIQALCFELFENGTIEDFFSLVTYVSQRVAVKFETYSSESKQNNKKQMPQYFSTLTKNFEFRPKNVSYDY